MRVKNSPHSQYLLCAYHAHNVGDKAAARLWLGRALRVLEKAGVDLPAQAYEAADEASWHEAERFIREAVVVHLARLVKSGRSIHSFYDAAWDEWNRDKGVSDWEEM